MASENHLNTRFASICKYSGWGLCLLTAALIAVGIGLNAEEMVPVNSGSSNEFWQVACGVAIDPANDQTLGGTAGFVDDKWAAYEVTSSADGIYLQGGEVYRVPRSEVEADFERVLQLLEQAHNEGGDTFGVKGYAKWKAEPKRMHTPENLLYYIAQERKKYWATEDIGVLEVSFYSEQIFWQRVHRAKWYWANIVFEWMFLSCLVLFAFWPFLRSHSLVRKTAHLALLPLMFMLPVYLGYAASTFTSVGPSGGVFYPHLLWMIRGGSTTEFDKWLLIHLPQILEPLSHSIGSPVSLGGRGMPGPTSMVISGAVIGGVFVGVRLGYREYLKNRARARSATP